MIDRYFKGDGRVFFAPVDKNNLRAGAFRWVGNVSALSLAIAEETIEQVESYTGRNQVVRKLPTKTTLTTNMTMSQFDSDNLAQIVNGVAYTVTPGTAVIDEVLGAVSDLKVDDTIIFKVGKNVSAVTVQDSGTTPVVLEQGVNYSINAKAGSITILNLLTDADGDPLLLTGNITVSYTPGEYSFTSIMTTSNKKVALRFEGLNMAEVDSDGSPQAVIVEIYIVLMSPAAEIPFIAQEFGSFALTGTGVLDTNRQAVDELGQFGYIAIVD